MVSSKSEFNRIDVAIGMAMMAAKVSDEVDVYLTGGDHLNHITEKYTGPQGLDMLEGVRKRVPYCRGGGIFTRQCLEHIKKLDVAANKSTPARVIVFSDSQDCDRVNKVPKPFGEKNYIVDVNAHKHGVNYQGIWTAELSGWSPAFIEYIAQYEDLGRKFLSW